MQNLKEPIAPAAAAKEDLPWPVSVVYHGSQHLTKTMQRMAGRLVSSLKMTSTLHQQRRPLSPAIR
ncbi:MAG: hypothetical protein DME72_04430 [Verrucomicrobia bacterium]|nr:MAG: hypothetical protein DME72_04430 [Verrucomicrobiota bacterium]